MMYRKAKISVIIPAYNAERTLAVTVQSVLDQTLKDVEIWIVDDGSKDNTGRLADEIAARDDRIRVIHQENQGAYMARVNALERINSEYFAFVDADDTVEPTMYARMYDFARQNDLDVVQCDAFGTKQKDPEFILGRKNVISDLVRPWLFEGRGGAYLWDKIFRRNLADVEIDSLRTSVFEDLVLNLYFFQNVNRFGYLHEGLYHYQPNVGSTTRNFTLRHVDDFLKAVEYRNKFAWLYGIDVNDLTLADWIVLNTRNLVNVALVAHVESESARLEHIHALFKNPAVKDAMARSGRKDLVDYLNDVWRNPVAAAARAKRRTAFRNFIHRIKGLFR